MWAPLGGLPATSPAWRAAFLGVFCPVTRNTHLRPHIAQACRAVHQQPDQFGLVGSSGQEGKSGHTELTPTEVVITNPVEIDRRIIEDYEMLLRLPTVQLSMPSMKR
jgi:hypothetical protein